MEDLYSVTAGVRRPEVYKVGPNPTLIFEVEPVSVLKNAEAENTLEKLPVSIRQKVSPLYCLGTA